MDIVRKSCSHYKETQQNKMSWLYLLIISLATVSFSLNLNYLLTLSKYIERLQKSYNEKMAKVYQDEQKQEPRTGEDQLMRNYQKLERSNTKFN